VGDDSWVSYAVAGRPGRALTLRDGAAFRVEARQGFVETVWSSRVAAGQFVGLAVEHLGLTGRARGAVSDSNGSLREGLSIQDVLRLAISDATPIVRLEDESRGRAVVWQVSPSEVPVPEVGVSADRMERTGFARLFYATCSQSLMTAAVEILEIVGQVAGHAWDWRVAADDC
jgi:hypothetical protein